MVSLLRGRQFIYDDASVDGGLPLTRRASSRVPSEVTATISGTNGSVPAQRPTPGTSAPVPGTGGRAARPD
jgi:hypothetical protein